MLHLDWEQMQHAIGISASARATLGAVTAGKLTMMKNTVDPMATQSGVLAALLAEKGYSGPEHVHRRQGRPHPLLRAGVEAEPAHRRSGRVVAHHTMWDESLPHRGADAHADLGRAGAGERQRPEARTTSPRFTSAPPRAAPTFSAIPASTIRTPKRRPTTRCPTSSPPPSPSARSRRCSSPMEKIMDPTIRAQLNKIVVVADPEIEKVFPALQRVIVDHHDHGWPRVQQAARLPQGRPAQSADRQGSGREIRSAGRAGDDRRTRAARPLTRFGD